MRRISFLPQAFADFHEWHGEDHKIYEKIVALIKDILRQPFTGLGKPEPLRHDLKGNDSRDNIALSGKNNA